MDDSRRADGSASVGHLCGVSASRRPGGSEHPPTLSEGILHSNHATLLAFEQNIVVGSLLRKCLIFQGKAAYLSLPPARLLIRDLGITIIE